MLRRPRTGAGRHVLHRCRVRGGQRTCRGPRTSRPSRSEARSDKSCMRSVCLPGSRGRARSTRPNTPASGRARVRPRPPAGLHRLQSRGRACGDAEHGPPDAKRATTGCVVERGSGESIHPARPSRADASCAVEQENTAWVVGLHARACNVTVGWPDTASRSTVRKGGAADLLGRCRRGAGQRQLSAGHVAPRSPGPM